MYSATSTRRGEFLAGMRATVPLIIGAAPFGIIFGALAVTSGISAAGTLGMSLFVFAGSAQFIAAGLVADQTGLAVIIFTTLIVNLRHALYSASLAPYMRHLPQRWLLPLGFWLTDESYAVVIMRYRQPDDSPYKHWYFFGSALLMYVNWQLCTLIGVLAGQSFAGAENWGLDFALVVTFVGIVVPLITTRPVLFAVVVSAVVGVLTYGLDNKIGILITAVVGIAAGLLAETLLQEDAFPPPAPKQRGEP